MSTKKASVATGMRALLQVSRPEPTEEEVPATSDQAPARPVTEDNGPAPGLSLVAPPARQNEPPQPLVERAAPLVAPGASEAPASAQAEQLVAQPTAASDQQLRHAAPAEKRVVDATRDNNDGPADEEPREASPKYRPKASSRETLEADAPKVSVGTSTKPAFRERDQTWTRKYGIVLPIDLMDEVAIHCVNPRQPVNTFVEDAVREALAKVGQRRRR